MAGVPEHVHEIQAENQASQVPENVRQEPRGPVATRPGRHAEVRAEKQGEQLDPDRCGSPEPVRVRGPRLQEKHGEHDKRRGYSPGKI